MFLIDVHVYWASFNMSRSYLRSYRVYCRKLSLSFARLLVLPTRVVFCFFRSCSQVNSSYLEKSGLKCYVTVIYSLYYNCCIFGVYELQFGYFYFIDIWIYTPPSCQFLKSCLSGLRICSKW